MKYVSCDITFKEVPDEVNLTLWISGCPRECSGCQTPELSYDIGKELTEEVFTEKLLSIGKFCSCITFLGGEQFNEQFISLSKIAKSFGKKVCLYTGADNVDETIEKQLDYLKTGPFVKELGPLSSKTTNQRFYRCSYPKRIDMTKNFQGD